MSQEHANSVAVIGMSGRFPGARSVAEFWANLRDGRECISRFTSSDLAEAGIDPQALQHPGYVNAGGVLDDVELFDAGFFGLSAREADITDPQQRLFLECVHEALEDAGYDPFRYEGAIGLYGGAAMSRYMFNLLGSPGLIESIGHVQLLLGNDKDHLTTRAAYKLNLRGPAITVQTTCSTSLVAVCLACQQLLDHECDLAVAGGVSVALPQKSGYLYQPGGINSPDGHCRAFDAAAQGTVGGNGVAVVALKRYEEALAEGDAVYAVIRGAAMNNDGSAKIGYTAPSIDGQAAVIATALALAGVDPDSVTYVEAHGTGTPLGDPIEVAALTQVFRASTARTGFCGIGSVKTNVGHLDCAAGVAGLIKTVLALAHRELPPSLHFQSANPKLELERSPFYVNTALRAWESGGPRRAGVSSFGIGGTNAHVVVEEAPARPSAGASRPFLLIPLSARSAAALDTTSRNLAAHIATHPDDALGDVAYTCAMGRRAHAHRRVVVAGTSEEAVRLLSSARTTGGLRGAGGAARDRRLIFLFPGQGAQYPGMGRDLFESELSFREEVDHCAELLTPELGGVDLRRELFVDQQAHQDSTTRSRLDQTFLAQPALFVIEYALARLLMRWGLRPDGMLGHSIGEYVAACLAGVVSLEDALKLLAARRRLMQRMPPGSMLAVELPEHQLRPLLEDRLDIAASNGPSRTVVSGPHEEIAMLEELLGARNVPCRRLQTSHAFHSRLMADAADGLSQVWSGIKRRPPGMRFLSNVTGDWISAEEATSPSYWARHLRHTVRFDAGLLRLLQDPGNVCVEVGPGTTLSALAREHPLSAEGRLAFASMRHPRDRRSDVATVLEAVGALWTAGFDIDWPAFYAGERRYRVHLPTYPFERARHWIDPPRPAASNAATAVAAETDRDVDTFLYRPAWHPQSLESSASGSFGTCVLFADPLSLAEAVAAELQGRGGRLVRVFRGEAFRSLGNDCFTVQPSCREDYDRLLSMLAERDASPDRILHLWTVTEAEDEPDTGVGAVPHQSAGFISLLLLAQALARVATQRATQLLVVSSGLHLITSSDRITPTKATVLGPVHVIPQELPYVRCRSIDLPSSLDAAGVERTTRQLIGELDVTGSDVVVAYRDGERLVRTFEPLPVAGDQAVPLRRDGVYLITGAFGGIGGALSEYLARTYQARLVLVGRSAMPPRDQWEPLVSMPRSDRTGRMVRLVQSLEALGAVVAVEQADIADRQQVSDLIGRSRDRFGRIDGVIHCAGVAGGGMLQRKTIEAAADVMRPKVDGTLALADCIGTEPLDCFVLCSSLTSVLGGFGQIDYCAANAFLDAYAQAAAGADTRVVSINWDTWGEVGMAVDTSVPRELEAQRQQNLDQGLRTREGVEVWRRALAAGVSQVAVSTRDLGAKLAGTMAASPQHGTAPVVPPVALSALEHARPDLETRYEAPRTPVEVIVCAIWEELLGVTPVGIDDDFFELGGHSLLAIQVTSRLRQALDAEVPVQVLFDAPTVKLLATDVEDRLAATPAGRGRLEELITHIERLSDDDVDQLSDDRAESRA